MAMDVESAEPVRSPDRAPAEPGLDDPLFFISHANAAGRLRPSGSPDQPFLDLFGELSYHVNELHYRPSGADPGFMDLTMAGGLPWERKILKAVGTCHVFIALLSSPYVNRPWCGLEWCAFQRRRSWLLEAGTWTETNECIVPVLWAPLRDEAMPPAVRPVERFTPSPLEDARLAASYKRQGLWGLRNTDQEAYNATVWSLAREIKQRLDDYRVEPLIPDSRHHLVNAFEAGE